MVHWILLTSQAKTCREKGKTLAQETPGQCEGVNVNVVLKPTNKFLFQSFYLLCVSRI